MIKDKSHTVPRSFGTHDGAFHADEVTACALLLYFGCVDRDKIIRSRDENELVHCDFICDVGGSYKPQCHLFDHHQAEYNGPLSSAGMILSFLRTKDLIDEELYMLLQNNLIYGVDAHDNGIDLCPKGVCSYSHIIAQFNAIEQDSPKELEQQAFNSALDFALQLIESMCLRYGYVQACKALVQHAMELDQEYLVFDKNIPWLENFFALGGQEYQAKYLVMPSGNHWKLRAIPPSLSEKMQVRKPLPQAWAGLLDENLERVSGIEGALFCHKGRFISVWKTKPAALQALAKALTT